MTCSFIGFVTEPDGLIVFVYPLMHMVESMFAFVTLGSAAPGLHFGSGKISLTALHVKDWISIIFSLIKYWIAFTNSSSDICPLAHNPALILIQLGIWFEGLELV